ncbi:MAG: nickel pincer cofactor biosynthesis protein LarC, partial [Methanothrix sp.]|nr:nickel pincer cofactor biosynthesis protein LarC [Methanothrix sp.]
SMKALLFDPKAGASGDMMIGCLLDLGADAGAVSEAVESVGCRLKVTRVERGGIMACRAKVISEGRYHSLEEARSLLEGSSLEGRALQRALFALDILAGAEGRVHGHAGEQARFHEIGSLDALADIAGSSSAFQSLGVARVLSLPVSVGGGLVRAAHGLLPVPAPATLEILRAFRIPWRGGPVDLELLTPTGASLLAAMVDEFLQTSPLLMAEAVGYGAGTHEMEQPNLLRGLIAEVPGPSDDEGVVQLETNVDDVTGEVIGHLIDRMMQAGSLDVSVLPALMKKGRSGSVIRALARQQDMEKLAALMMKETGSLGVRVFPSLHRLVAEREERII